VYHLSLRGRFQLWRLLTLAGEDQDQHGTEDSTARKPWRGAPLPRRAPAASEGSR